MIGLILQIFKEIKNEETTRMSNFASFREQPSVLDVQRSFELRLGQDESIIGIKNVVQEFMETMYQCMENEIYAKFNVEMRRMVLKHREAEKILKKVNEKLTCHADIFEMDKKMRQKERAYEEKLQEARKIKEKSDLTQERDRVAAGQAKHDNERLQGEISRLREQLDKYQNILLNRI